MTVSARTLGIILLVVVPVACAPHELPTSLDLPGPLEARTPSCPGVPVGTSTINIRSAGQVTIGVGSVLEFAVVNQLDAPVPDCALSWSVSNKKVATIDASGVVAGRSVGGPITVRAKTRSRPTMEASVQLIVGQPVASVEISPTAPPSLTPGKTQQLNVVVRDVAGNPLPDRAVTWSSATPGVATVSSTGLVTSIAPGTVQITATSEGVLGSVTVMVEAVRFVQVAAGQFHSCGIVQDGTAYCWGDNGNARLGTGDLENSLVPRPVAGSLRFTHLVASWQHTCGITDGGDAYCWGLGPQLGIGSTAVVTPQPTMVLGGHKWAKLTVGDVHTCGLAVGGVAYCWGIGQDDGQIGTGVRENTNVPLPVVGGLVFHDLSAGAYHTCGVTTSGIAHCWGRNDYGGLGIGTGGDRYAPTAVSTSLVFRSIAGGGDNSCGITVDDKGYCWGSDLFGRLGTGGVSGSTNVPVPMAFAGDIAELGLSPTHGCLLDRTKQVYCWGNNEAGQVGDNTTVNRSAPVAVVGLTGATHVSVNGRPDSNISQHHQSCASRNEGNAVCWGANNYGQLGDGTTVGRLTPTAITPP